MSTVPLTPWMSTPPSSSLPTGVPNARSTTGGPATKTWETPRTMSEKCEWATRAAPRPATGPRAAATTGTSDITATTRSQPGLPGT